MHTWHFAGAGVAQVGVSSQMLKGEAQDVLWHNQNYDKVTLGCGGSQ